MVSTAPLFLVSSCLHGILIGNKDPPWWLMDCQCWTKSFKPTLTSFSLDDVNVWVREKTGRAGMNLCLQIRMYKKTRFDFFIMQMNFYFKFHFFPEWHSPFFHLSPFPGVVSECQEGLWGVWWGCTWSPFSLSSMHYGSCWEVPSHLASLSTQGVAEATSFPASLPLLWVKKPCWGHGGA